MTTIENFRSRLNEDYVRDPNNHVWNLSTKDRAINKGYTRVQQDLNRNQWENENNATSSTVAGSELYTLPDNFVRMKLVRYKGAELTKVTRKDTKEWADTPQSGTPAYYYIYNNKLGLYPVPDAIWTIDLEYYEAEATITTSQDSQTPAIADDAILLYAAYKLYLGVRDINSAGLFREDYENEISRLKLSIIYDDENMRMGYERTSRTVGETELD